jgi:hypothetical protein
LTALAAPRGILGAFSAIGKPLAQKRRAGVARDQPQEASAENSSARHVPNCSVESGDKLLGDGRGQFRHAFKAAKQALGKSHNKDVPRNRRRRHPRKRLGAKRLLHSDPEYEETLTNPVYCCRKVTGQEIPHF